MTSVISENPERAATETANEEGGIDVETVAMTAAAVGSTNILPKEAVPPSSSRSVPPKNARIMEAAYRVGEFKANVNISYLLVQSILAGIFKSLGCTTFLVVGGGVLGAALFPVGLIAITLTSTELFTGDLLILTVSFLAGKVSLYAVLRNHVVAWCGNFIGTLLWASIIGFASGTIVDNGQEDLAISLAVTKTTQPWGHIVGKAVGANFLVCLAIWHAMVAQEVISKVAALWFPIVSFVTAGLEHVVANMYFIPLGMMLGADVTVGQMLWWNIVPSTIGNIIGGAFGIALPFWYLFDPTSEETNLLADFQQTLRDNKIVQNIPSLHGSRHDEKED